MARVPGAIGGWRGRPEGPAAPVGVEERGLDVVARPMLIAAGLDGAMEGADLDRAVAGFAGSVVAGRVRRREEMSDAVVAEEGSEGVRFEGGAVVGLEDERRAVLGEESGEGADRGLGRLIHDRERVELPAAAEVADHEQIREDAVDGEPGFGVVGGPDGKRKGISPIRHKYVTCPMQVLDTGGQVAVRRVMRANFAIIGDKVRSEENGRGEHGIGEGYGRMGVGFRPLAGLVSKQGRLEGNNEVGRLKLEV